MLCNKAQKGTTLSTIYSYVAEENVYETSQIALILVEICREK